VAPSEETEFDLDLGHGVKANWRGGGEHDRAGLLEYHQCDGGICRSGGLPGGLCGGSILFDLPGMREAYPGRELWTVEQQEPLTLSPSVRCGCRGCTHHGWIRGGRWVPA